MKLYIAYCHGCDQAWGSALADTMEKRARQHLNETLLRSGNKHLVEMFEWEIPQRVATLQRKVT